MKRILVVVISWSWRVYVQRPAGPKRLLGRHMETERRNSRNPVLCRAQSRTVTIAAQATA